MSKEQIVDKIVSNLRNLDLHFLKCVLAYTSKLAE